MDIALLSRMVSELILEHDQVGLPGVGTFVAEMVPATFSDKGYTINPPYRKLVFHPNCLEDKLLVDLYAKSNNLDEQTAAAFIKDYLQEMKKVLQDRKTLTFPGLGRLRATKGNTFFFIPNEDLDIYPEGFGLEPISMKTHQETDEEVHIAVHSLAEELAAPQEPEPQPAEEPQPEAEPEPASEPEPEEPKAKRGFAWWLIPVILFLLAVIAFAAFIVIAQINPELLDPILYSPEELRILRG